MGAKNSHTAATTTQHGTEFDKNNSRSSSLNVNFKSTKSGFKNETQQANKTVTRNPALPAKTVLDKKVTQTIVLNTKLYSTEAKNSHAMATKTQHSIEIDHNNSNNVNPTSTTGAFKTGTQKANKTDTNNPILDKEFGTINIAKLYNFSKPNNTNEKALQINQTFQSAESVARQLYTRTKSNLANIADLYFFTGDQPQGIFNCSYDDTINITDYEPLVNGSYLYENHLLIPPHLVGLYDYEIVFDGSKRFAPLHKRACVCHLKNCITLCSDSILDFYQDAFEAGDQEFLKLFSIRTTLSNGSVVFKNIVNDFEHIILNEFCEPFVYPLSPEKDPKSSWTLFENGTLLRHSDNDYLKKTEYCFELYEDKFNNVMYYLVNPLNCAKENDKLKPIDRFSNWIQVFSIPFFIAIIIAYSCLPELRNVHGKCFISYLICLTMSYGILSYINLSKEPLPPVPCSILAYMHHYMQLSHYTWLGIICYDTWKSCDSTSYDQPYWKYALYGVNLPLLLTLMAFAAQKSNLTNVWKPGITQFKCGLEVNSLAAFFYLFGPCLIVLIFCLRAFCLTYTIIQTNDKKVTKIKDKSCESPRHRFFLYLRLFLMMGLSWFMDVISYFLALVGMKFLSGLIDYINAMQGLFIFASFIGRKRVRQIIRQRIHTKYHRMS